MKKIAAYIVVFGTLLSVSAHALALDPNCRLVETNANCELSDNIVDPNCQVVEASAVCELSDVAESDYPGCLPADGGENCEME